MRRGCAVFFIMNCLSLIVGCLLVLTAQAQFEKGFVKILEDQRYQDGANFGNFRNQEDGIKYKEETNAQGIRTGFWEYPDETGKIVKVEFEAGPGIGFRIVSSNVADPTPKAAKTVQREPQVVQPRAQHQPQHQPQPRQAPRVQPEPVVRVQQQPQHQQFVQPPQQQQFVQHTQQQQQSIPIPLARQPNNLVIAREPSPVSPEPQNLFDYPADLQFFRDAGGHRFKFSAV